MPRPTPKQIAESIGDVARGYRAEILGMRPDLTIAVYLDRMARHVAALPADDPRLDAFTWFTDEDGNVWLSDLLHDFYAYSASRQWSPGRWLTELADALAAMPTPAVLPDPKPFDDAGRAGFRPTRLVRDDQGQPVGLIATRRESR